MKITNKTGCFYGDEVRKRIEAFHLSISEAARMSGFPQGTLNNWINGVRNPKRSNVEKLASALHCSIEDISSYKIQSISMPEVVSETPKEFSEDKYKWLYNSILEELNFNCEKSSLISVSSQLGVSHSYIAKLLHGDSNVEDFKLSAFLHLFPDLEINLNIRRKQVAEQQDDKGDTGTSKELLLRMVKKMTEDEAKKTIELVDVIFPNLKTV